MQASASDIGNVQQSAVSGAISDHDEVQLLTLFVDEPGQAAAFSIHNICKTGAQHG